VIGRFLSHHDNATQLHRAHHSHPRTRIYIGLHQSTAWIARVAEHLSRLTSSASHVMATACASTTTDATLHTHCDARDGAIIQLSGAKTWHLGPGLLHPHQPTEHVTTAPATC
jgi:ribosomal protein L16 Arg81 hydroxylase